MDIKSTIRRTFIITLLLVLTLEIFSQAPPVTSVGTATYAGGIYSVPITVTDFSNVGNISLSLNYNTSELVYTGVTLNSGLEAVNAVLTPVSDQSGLFRLSYVSGTAITLGSPAGTLLVITFQAKPGNQGIHSILSWSTLQGACDMTPPAPGSFTPQITTANLPDFFKDGFIDILSTDITLTLTLFLEGLYTPAGDLNQAQGDAGNQFPGITADQITVELHSAGAGQYSTIIYTAPNTNLNTSGQASLAIPSAFNGTYYITIRHRNSIETVSSAPLSFTGNVMFDFSTSSSQAFGSNLKNKSGTYVIYSGDVNQDGLIDISDMILVDNLSALASTGYLAADINGDGLIDITDMILVDNNSSQAIGAITP